MLENLTCVKTFLGKYYPDLLQLSNHNKYINSGLNLLFDQRFLIQNTKLQMIVDPTSTGLSINISGNEITVSKYLYDHPSVIISNSLEDNPGVSPINLYDPGVFSSLAYLICQNHVTLKVTGEVDEPIYITYSADYETFLNSVVIVDIADNISAEIVEELQSFSALNSVTRYVVGKFSKLHLTTFYQNNVVSMSFFYRHVTMDDHAVFEHILLGKGIVSSIDETRITPGANTSIEMLGIIDSNGKKFNSILQMDSTTNEYDILINYKNIMYGAGSVGFYPITVGKITLPDTLSDISSITLDYTMPTDEMLAELQIYISDIINRVVLERITGASRYYNNKAKFVEFT